MDTDDQKLTLNGSVIRVHPCSSVVPSLPVPRAPIDVRVATMDDLPFLDSLQKQHSKALGFFPRAQMEGYIANQWILIAEDAATKQPVGYCASRDRYLKRDELGVIYQLCVAPGDQRKLVGASLIKAVFERSAYGCRLYCCWCAQDLEANYFWESLGFVPIAFRGGSGKKKRIHIFWQRRIDTELPIADCRLPSVE
jgi:GNAT superfamily N-acetyltransferase